MASIRIGYFLEDIAHQEFLQTLVERLVAAEGHGPIEVQADIRNATGGKGQVFDDLRRFLRDAARERERRFDLVIVAIDGNCRGYTEVRNQILAKAQQARYPGSVVCAVPDPHIERWYLADPAAVRTALRVGQVPSLPRYKCERARYKNALREAIKQAGVIAPLGGAEYGQDIARVLDLFTLGKADPAFRHLVDSLREAIAPILGGSSCG